MIGRIAAILIAGALAVAAAQHAAAQETFTGKTIRLYIGTSPGGGYDTYGRLVARHLGRQLPGNPSVVPQNMPGAASLTLTNFLYNQAARDGTAIAIINQAMPTEQRLVEQNINYDSDKFNWIGRVSSAVEMLIVWHTVPVASIDDVRNREVIVGGTGPTSSTVFIPYLLNNLAGAKFKVILGFNGTTEIGLAMERGEIDGSATPLESLTSYRANWVREKKIKILLQQTATRDAEVADIPAMVELGRTEEAKRILAFFASAADIGRSIVAPPAMAPETVKTLRRGFDKMFEDPAFLDEVKRAGIQLKPLTGERLQGVVAEVAKFPPELVQKARVAREKSN
jgi:tripartite-type tricarboxylate transporter receptor subunit TctC